MKKRDKKGSKIVIDIVTTNTRKNSLHSDPDRVIVSNNECTGIASNSECTGIISNNTLNSMPWSPYPTEGLIW